MLLFYAFSVTSDRHHTWTARKSSLFLFQEAGNTDVRKSFRWWANKIIIPPQTFTFKFIHFLVSFIQACSFQIAAFTEYRWELGGRGAQIPPGWFALSGHWGSSGRFLWCWKCWHPTENRRKQTWTRAGRLVEVLLGKKMSLFSKDSRLETSQFYSRLFKPFVVWSAPRKHPRDSAALDEKVAKTPEVIQSHTSASRFHS